MMEIRLDLSNQGVANVLRGVKALKQNLKNEIIETDIVNQAADDVKRLLNENVSALGSTVDGNSIGFVDSVAALNGSSVRWRGDPISYIEFGTGNRGYSGGYPAQAFMAANNYMPDPTKFQWMYERNGEAQTSYGLSPQAPVYKTVQQAKQDKLMVKAAKKVIDKE